MDMLGCYDCGLEYGSIGWMDALVADDVWHQITPTGRPDGSGILCINCIARRCAELGLRDVPVQIVSGALVCGDVISIRPIRTRAFEYTELFSDDATAPAS